ncbi:MAG: hypothetical protein PW844_23805 [Pantoea sp.]|uniref:hypothetical protein n=1 Tax=unclassified Pantoea TaxID=2630326 RepID=UPI00238F0B8E|nr:hypothetical protein [Pantoea sp.]MDE1189454.1 hypothetical protein [Pantoea sp.]
MQTISIALTSNWTQLATGTGIVTAQLIDQSTAYLYIGDSAPSDNAPCLRIPADGVTLANGAIAWVKGSGTLVAATV